ncbi:MAG: hypothetical protein RHS_2638 [Robinsoniella sp. RHS]|nr:MAG: hypothetical protein RHS_2638 [Robinsoniella sp. RHS]
MKGGDFMLKLYSNIKLLREELGLSQDDLAKKTGYTSRSSIAKIEKGLVDLSQTKIDLFANALNTTPAKLMGWDEPTYYHKLGKTEALDNFKADGIAGIEVLNDSDEIKILDIFRKFNSTGKLEATKRLEELSYIPKYCKKDSIETN